MAEKKKWWKAPLAVCACVFLIVVLLMSAVQLLLSPKVCTRLVKEYAPMVIDGELSLSSATISLFSHFPAVTVDIDDFIVTYPTRYADSAAVLAVPNFLELAGAHLPGRDTCVNRMDTLASFKNFTLSVNVLSLLGGNLRVKNLELESPRLFIHNYADSTSNLDIIKLSLSSSDSEETQDSSSFVLHSLTVKNLFIGSKSNIVLTDEGSELYAMTHLKKLDFSGKIKARDPLGDRFSFAVDTFFVAGSYRKDTLLFGLDHLYLDNARRKLECDLMASVSAATRQFGRINLPVAAKFNCRLSDIGDDSFRLNVDDFSADIASLHLDAAVDAMLADTIDLKGFVSIPEFDVQHFLTNYATKIYPPAMTFRSNAFVAARLDVDGKLDPELKFLPAFKASVDIPKSNFSMVGNDFEPEVELHATAAAEQGGPVEVDIRQLHVDAPGLFLDLTGSGSDVLGTDPDFDADLSLSVALDRLLEKLGRKAGFYGDGSITGSASGNFKLSNLNIYNIDGIKLTAKAKLENVSLNSMDDSLKIYCHNMDINAGNLPKRPGKAVHSSHSTRKFFSISAKSDSVLLHYVDQMHLSGRNMKLFASSSPELIKVSDSLEYSPLMLNLNMGKFSLEGTDSIRLSLKDTRNNIMIRPAEKGGSAPKISLSSLNDRVRIKMGPNRFSLHGLDFKLTAKMNQDEREQRVKALRDSLMRRHPDWNDDSLKVNFMKKRQARQIPEWLTEADFKKSDFDFNFGETFKNYFKLWSLNGNLKLEKARIFTPMFPLKTSVSDFSGSFDNNKVSLDSLRLNSGASDVEVSGSVTKLRRALLGHGTPKLKIEICSDTLAINELLSAFARGQENMEKNMSYLSSLEDDKYEALIEQRQAELAKDEQNSTGLIVIPANLDAQVLLRGKKASYSTLNIDSFRADMTMNKRCVLISDVAAVSDAGTVKLNAFYSTKTKNDLTTGFDLNLIDISADEVISLIPQIDTIMPLLKSFAGNLNCGIAATARLDTNMNIVMPSIDGVLRISGKNLRFTDNKDLEKLGRKLLFHNPKNAHIDSMTVEGIIKDNKLEIFPFILMVDRWTIALAGIQGLDQKFNYHASIIKSPLIFKIGADIYGDDFDHFKVKLGKPKFRKAEVPSFSVVIDTTKVNLLHNIRNIFEKGVENAVRTNASDEALKREREALKYTRSAALDSLEALSAKEKHLADSLSLSK